MAELTQLLCGEINLYEERDGLNVLRPHALQISEGVCAHRSPQEWAKRTAHLVGLEYVGTYGDEWPAHTWKSSESVHGGGNREYVPPAPKAASTRAEKAPGPCESPHCPACRGADVEPFVNRRTWPGDEVGLPPHPAPERSSREPEPEGVTYPAAVLTMAERARQAGLMVRLQSARGRGVHSTTGRALAVKNTYAVQMAFPDRVGNAYAVHDGKGWPSVWLTPTGVAARPPMRVTITDLSDWLKARGEVPEQWYRDVQAAMEQRTAAKKATARKSSGSAKRESGG